LELEITKQDDFLLLTSEPDKLNIDICSETVRFRFYLFASADLELLRTVFFTLIESNESSDKRTIEINRVTIELERTDNDFYLNINHVEIVLSMFETKVVLKFLLSVFL